MMALQELDTAVREQVPIFVFVLNDEAYGAEYHMLNNAGGYAEAASIDSPHIEAVAETLGAEGHTVRSPSDLEDLSVVLGTSPDGPVVVDCHINRDVKNLWWE
jgi:thiamine pyrophosphate-dependent acetolactate synthase large subunit-like protein